MIDIRTEIKFIPKYAEFWKVISILGGRILSASHCILVRHNNYILNDIAAKPEWRIKCKIH